MPSILREIGEVKNQALEKVGRGFEKWAWFCFDHPLWVIFISILTAGALSTGLLPSFAVWIDGAENLYSLPQSTAREHGNQHRSYFPESRARTTQLIITPTAELLERRGTDNILDWGSLETIHRIDGIVTGRSVHPTTGRKIGISTSDETIAPLALKGSSMKNVESLVGGNEDITFEDLCLRIPAGRCSSTSVLNLNLNATQIFSPSPDPEVLSFDGISFGADGTGTVPTFFLGNPNPHPCVRSLPYRIFKNALPNVSAGDIDSAGNVSANITCITEATGFLMTYDLKENPSELVNYLNDEWEKSFIEVMTTLEELDGLQISINAFRSRDDELRKATSESSDILFVVLTFIALIGYAALLNFSCDLFHSKTYAALAGCGAASLGLTSGMGLTSYCGIAFTPTVLICPFLVMGIGVDDMFVIINSYSLAYTIDDPKQRCAASLKDSGLSITITTSTNLIAFAIGATSPYLSIKNFCIASAASLFMGYIFVLTFFVAFLCLDARREAAGRLCLFCVPKTSKRPLRNLPDLETFELVALIVRKEHDKETFEKEDMVNLTSMASETMASNMRQAFPVDLPQSLDSQSRRSRSNRHSRDHRECRTQGCPAPRQLTENSTRNVATTSHEITGNSARSTTYSDRFEFSHDQPASQPPSRRNHERGASSGRSRDENRVPVSCGDAKHLRKEILSQSQLEKPLERPLTPNKRSSDSRNPSQRGSKSAPPVITNSIIDEPKGNVGRLWRLFFLKYYGPFLTNRITKICVIISFCILFCFGCYGVTKLEYGLELSELAPSTSYLQNFDSDTRNHFALYDVPVEVFFTDDIDWSTADARVMLSDLEQRLRSRNYVKYIINPMQKILDDEALFDVLTVNNRTQFERGLKAELEPSGRYSQFQLDFAWEGPRLLSWKMKVFPHYMAYSEKRASFMVSIRSDCSDLTLKENEKSIDAVPYNFMMIFYESDLGIMSTVLVNMFVAAIALLFVSMFLISEIQAGFLIIAMMVLIDVELFGFMHVVGVKLNMVSMINLIISIGFAVDYAAHITHTFTHCHGKTRNFRTIETFLLMGNPVFHGAASTLLGIGMLGFSTSYIFSVFFRMMSMVILFGIIHGIVLLPVVLSIIGSQSSHAKGDDALSTVSMDIESSGVSSDTATGTVSTTEETDDRCLSAHSKKYNRIPPM